ncbi:hypothetical protein C9374_013489 [Naegleria lovaniensis]|uniref:t-SNARE coiled-coil homology domain-containing protein n=1 Tax=Naegleria lovaniensis TaxID=51637 RepID=A0AA88KQQ3_NAELO|nr:uncharacterized protein C9374_013489 [Naegleria lovaniensis]KAG2392004.1 hypothetical protein C9374_013489 [Naegleria lovaniensis]
MSSSSPAYYDEEIEEICKEISKKIVKVNKGAVDGKKQAFFDEIDKDMERAKKAFKNMYRLVRKEGVDQTWKKKLSQHQNEIRKLEQNLATAKDKSTKDELLGTSSSAGNEKKKDPSKKKRREEDDEVVEVVASEKVQQNKSRNDQLADELFKEIYETQGDSLDIVKRLIDKADETKTIAAESMEILKRQREQLEKIDKEMDELGSNIKRGSNEIKSFMRRLATDKLIMILILLVVLAVLGIIIWRIVDYVIKKVSPPSNDNNNNNGKVTPSQSPKPASY